VSLGEASLGLEDLAPQLVEVALGLLGWGLDVSLLIDGVVLAALDGVEKDLGGLLDALEELIVLGAASGSLLIGVVLEDLLAVGLLDLVLGSLVAVLGETENLVVILSLNLPASVSSRLDNPLRVWIYTPSSPWPRAEASWDPKAR
jgi:hypothetical protein